MLAALGDLVEDVVIWVRGQVRSGTDNDATVVRRRGGSAANVAAFAAAAAAGSAARFLGKVGTDPVGERLLAELAASGVDVACVERGGRTGSVVVMVAADGERTMFPDRGAATDLRALAPGWHDGVDVLHVPAYSLVAGTTADVAVAALVEARRRGILTSVDASSVGALVRLGVERAVAMLAELAPDVLLANGDEADLLALRSRSPARAVTVVKHGPRPTELLEPGGREPRCVEVPPVQEVLDATGAGDAFAAGFLRALSTGAEPAVAAEAGHALAARVLGQPGATLAPGGPC